MLRQSLICEFLQQARGGLEQFVPATLGDQLVKHRPCQGLLVFCGKFCRLPKCFFQQLRHADYYTVPRLSLKCIQGLCWNPDQSYREATNRAVDPVRLRPLLHEVADQAQSFLDDLLGRQEDHAEVFSAGRLAEARAGHHDHAGLAD